MSSNLPVITVLLCVGLVVTNLPPSTMGTPGPSHSDLEHQILRKHAFMAKQDHVIDVDADFLYEEERSLQEQLISADGSSTYGMALLFTIRFCFIVSRQVYQHEQAFLCGPPIPNP